MLKAQRLARDAAEKPATPKGARKEKPPIGTKGEEISSQGQVDEGTRPRTLRRGTAKSQEPRTQQLLCDLALRVLRRIRLGVSRVVAVWCSHECERPGASLRHGPVWIGPCVA